MFSFKHALPICTSVLLSCTFVYCAPRTKDPNDCHNPICADKMDFFNAAKKQFEQEKTKNTSSPKSTVPSSSSATVSTAAATPVPLVPQKSETDLEDRDCPMDRAELGRNTWSLLHSMAAFYPDSPQPSHQKHAINFIKALAVLYPCSFCAMEFRESIKQSPPTVESRESFSLWLCERHNEVNERLNKECFPCTLEALDRRWRKGVPGCWNYVEEEDEEAREEAGDTSGKS